MFMSELWLTYDKNNLQDHLMYIHPSYIVFCILFVVII